MGFEGKKSNISFFSTCKKQQHSNTIRVRFNHASGSLKQRHVEQTLQRTPHVSQRIVTQEIWSASELWAMSQFLPCKGCGHSESVCTRVHVRSPWVPLHLLLVTEAKEAWADAHGHPGADSVEEPLEGEEAGHRDGEDEQAEWVHGHPTPLREGRRAEKSRSENK